jgi:transposase
MLAKTHDNEEIIERVAACDIGKAELVCCVRVPDEERPGRRLQEVASYSTMTRPLLSMADRLTCLGVTRVLMEATSDYWKPVFYLLEAAGFETWLASAKDVKHLPGRPKTDRLDCIWLCKVAERQMIRPSFVPPPPFRKLRDLTRYRADLVAARTAEKNRAEKLLEDAQIKLSVVVSDIFGASGRDMLAALVAGERNPPGAGRAGPAQHAQEDHCAGGGVHRLLHRSPRLSAGPDARPRRCDYRRHRCPGCADRRTDRPVRRGSEQAG